MLPTGQFDSYKFTAYVFVIVENGTAASESRLLSATDRQKLVRCKQYVHPILILSFRVYTDL